MAPGTDTMELLQLADACFPAGGFAFSNGLESLAKLGYVKSMGDFEQYLACHLEQITSAEIPFLNSAFLCADLPIGSGFLEVAREWDAWLFMPTQRKASLAQGQAWARALEETYDQPGIRGVRPEFLRHGIPLHFLMIFAATLKAAGKSLADIQRLILHMALRDQLGAAVRLGLMGSLQAQRMHRKFIGVGEDCLTRRRDWKFGLAARAAPMIDMGQASHPYLYSKLFQS